MRFVQTLALALAIGCSATAIAQDEEAPMSAWGALDAMPPRTSYDVGLHMSLGTIGYWREDTPPWVGFGIRGGGGRVYRSGHRLGGQLSAMLEGPVPLFYSVSLEPAATWDLVRRNLQLGASIGPAFMFHSKLEVVGPDNHFGVAPVVAARVGYSEGWTRVGRRFFAVLEPKLRWVRGGPDASVSLLIGSGRGY